MVKMSILFFAGLLFFGGCSVWTTSKEIRVGVLSWSGYEPLGLADALDYYSEDEIKIIRFPSVIDVLGAMRNGTIDVAALTIDESIVYAQENPELRAFLVCDVSNGGDGIVAKKGITTAAQLKGKRIAAEESALSSYILHRFLQLSGFDTSDITVVPINYDIQLGAFSSDKADAVVTYNPVKDQLIAQGGTLLFDSSKMQGEIVDVLIARESLLKKKRETVSKLIEGWYRALEYMKKYPQDANKKMAAFENVPVKLFERSLKGIIIPNRDESIRMLSKESGSLHESSALLIENMREQGLLREDSSFKDFFTADYVRK